MAASGNAPFCWKTWQLLMPSGLAPFCWHPLRSTHLRGLAASGPCGAAWHTLVSSVSLEHYMYCHMVSQHIMLVIAAKPWLNKSMTITNGKNTDMVEVPVGQSGHLGMVLVLAWSWFWYASMSHWALVAQLAPPLSPGAVSWWSCGGELRNSASSWSHLVKSWWFHADRK